MNSSSFEQQHHNGSILWSDEETDENNQSFLPIGLPPTQHRLIAPNTTSPPPMHIEETSTHEEQQDDIDVVHIRPLNNLSAFNFDCQQMNAERLNDNLSPKPITRRTIFATKPIPNDRHQQIPSSPTVTIERQSFSSSSSSSSSSSPPKPQQSFTSDTSIINTNWLEQQRIHDANTHNVPPSIHSDRSATNQVYFFRLSPIKYSFGFFFLAIQS